MSTVGVQDTSNRWNQAGCSLIWASTGMKFAVMKRETSSSAYDSASSRAHPPQAGAALKSISSGRSEFLASESAASTSVLFHGTAMCISSHRGWVRLPAPEDARQATMSMNLGYCRCHVVPSAHTDLSIHRTRVSADWAVSPTWRFTVGLFRCICPKRHSRDANSGGYHRRGAR